MLRRRTLATTRPPRERPSGQRRFLEGCARLIQPERDEEDAEEFEQRAAIAKRTFRGRAYEPSDEGRPRQTADKQQEWTPASQLQQESDRSRSQRWSTPQIIASPKRPAPISAR
jgi:hypothetical protein